MPRFDPVQTNFSAGELSPRLMGNFQIDKYKQGLKTLENMFVQTHGGISRRGGFKYVAEVKTSAKTTILHEFKYRDEFSYILEFGDQYVRFYRNQAQIVGSYGAWVTTTVYAIGDLVTESATHYRCLEAHTAGVFATDLTANKWVASGGAADLAYEIVTTYLEAELRDLRFTQDEDTLYIVHKNHLPAKLTRTGHAIWTLANLVFSYGSAVTVDTFVEPTIHDWTIREPANTNGWTNICWSPELRRFVAVSYTGTNNRVMTSSDGINWTARVSTEDNSWVGLCWSPQLGLFCAVSSDGTNRVMTSPDGVAWTARSAAAANAWQDVCWSPELGLFCAVSSDGVSQVMTSPDGITWTVRAEAQANTWVAVCWSPELKLFCAVSNDGVNRVMTSPDGSAWTVRVHDGANEWREICWSPDLTLFVAVSSTDDGSGQVMTSPDGTTWTQRSTPEDNSWRDVCWSPELTLFYAVSIDGSNRLMSSPDGTTWTVRSQAGLGNWFGICWSPQLRIFCAVSYGSTYRVMTGYGGLINGTYADVELETIDGYGSEAIATVVVVANVLSTVTITTGGYVYEVNDTLRIPYADVGGSKDTISCDIATISSGDIPAEWVATNYPTLVWFFEQRFLLAATPDEPNKLWGSRTADYFNLYTGDGLANEALIISIKEATKLLWVTTSNVILLGAHNAPFKVSANSFNEALTPTNIRAVRIANYGSAFLPAIDLDGDSVFVQKGLRKMRRLEYDSVKDKHKATDVTILSEHITESGLIDVAYIDEPNPMIFGVRTDGVLVSLTYEPEYGVFGWDRHPVGGTDALVKSIAASDAVTADEDELWAIVSRTIDGSTVQYVEFLKQGLTPEDVLVDAFFVDSGVTKTGSAFTNFDGLDHLEGQTVQVFADGVVQATKVVASGAITITAADKAHAGLACDATIETLPLEGGNPIGSAMGKTKRITNVVLRLYNSLKFIIGDISGGRSDTVDLGATLFTDDTDELDFYGDHETGGQMKITITDPVPFTLLAIMYKARTGE